MITFVTKQQNIEFGCRFAFLLFICLLITDFPPPPQKKLQELGNSSYGSMTLHQVSRKLLERQSVSVLISH